mmetsp:Transcript_37322/g.96497  ORF Transcript_37322/g.96497 Transcript_37322/m.96497 type:complete len:270 (-) Transcript_37322:92-901(-)
MEAAAKLIKLGEELQRQQDEIQKSRRKLLAAAHVNDKRVEGVIKNMEEEHTREKRKVVALEEELEKWKGLVKDKESLIETQDKDLMKLEDHAAALEQELEEERKHSMQMINNLQSSAEEKEKRLFDEMGRQRERAEKAEEQLLFANDQLRTAQFSLREVQTREASLRREVEEKIQMYDGQRQMAEMKAREMEKKFRDAERRLKEALKAIDELRGNVGLVNEEVGLLRTIARIRDTNISDKPPLGFDGLIRKIDEVKGKVDDKVTKMVNK